MADIKFSYYDSKEAFNNSEVSLDNYIGFVQHGTNQDVVLNARAKLQAGDKAAYSKLKNASKAVTASCIFKSGDSKIEKNIQSMNGLIVLDIDNEQIEDGLYRQIRDDQYTFVIHRSFSGINYCVFIKIDPDKFEDSFLGLSEYYSNTFGVSIDPSCSNKNRLRYLSYDPDIYHNPKSTKYVPKNTKRFAAPKSKDVNYIFNNEDFDNILRQISDRSIDLCQEDYFRYVRIGMSIASKFGINGEDKFKFICQFGSKYDEDRAIKDYKGFVNNSKGACTIGTFYYYCKQDNIEVYSEKTKIIINRVKVGKSQGSPTVDSIVSNLKVANNIIATDSDRALINELIISPVDYSHLANEGISEIEQMQSFILDNYSPSVDMITNITYINENVHLTDTETNDIYLNCKKSFSFKVQISDVRSVINSNSIKKINILSDFIGQNKGTYTGYIEQYIKCIHPQTDYNIWAFKKWIVGALHNWTASKNEKLVCPLTLVLTGQQHGTGKTSFLRNIMPSQLEKYVIEAKINGHDKDSMYMLCNSLLVIDDEFGGKAFKDVKEYKAISDMNIITQRRPYERESKTFKRRAILCGTSNEIDILKDVTGNRRILPINVDRVDYDMMVSIPKYALIMEAYALLRGGFQWIVRTEADIAYIRDNTQQNENILPIEEIFFKHFSESHTTDHTIEIVYNQGEILEYLNLYSVLKPTKYDLKEILVKNKITYQSHRQFDGIVKKGIKLYMRPTMPTQQTGVIDKF